MEGGSTQTDSPLIVLLHGWGAPLSLYEGVLNHLSAGFHVLAPVLPGFEGSDEPSAPMNVDDYVSFVIHFLTELAPDSKEVILIGHSMGGRIIIKLCAGLDPDSTQAVHFHIPKIILTDSAGVRPIQSASVSGRAARYKRMKNILTFTGLGKLFPGLMEALRMRYGSADYRAASPLMRETLVKVINEDLTPLFPSIRMPALLIWGDQDTATPLSDGQLMEKMMPEAGLAVMKGCSHYPFLDAPDWYLRIIDSFLGTSK